MNAFVTSNPLETLSQTACATLWRASWQAGLTVLFIALLCRALPHLPASSRCWLWRLALLKFVLTLLWPLAISLPVLPAPEATVTAPLGLPQTRPALQAATKMSTVATQVSSAPISEPSLTPKTAAQRPEILSVTVHAPSPTPLVPKLASGVAPTQLTLPTRAIFSALFALYGAGVAVCLVRLIGRGWQTRSFLRRQCQPINDPEIVRDMAGLARRMGLTRVPRLLTAPAVTTSQLVAAHPPALVLPQHGSDREVRNLMLAHELAHLQRRDLWWSGFSAAAHVLFFFHPLLWLARREEELACEMACDALVLEITRAAPARYGALLVEAARGRRNRYSPAGAAVSLGIANEIAHIIYGFLPCKRPLRPCRSDACAC